MKNILLSFITLLFFGFIFYLAYSVFDESKPLFNLALKKEKKTYLFSILGSTATEIMIKTHQDPMIMKTTSVIEIDDEIYVEVGALENVVSLISNNYTIFSKEKKLYNGYVTKNDQSIFFTQKIITEDGQKIGEFNHVNLIQLKNKNNFFDIKWIATPTIKTIENCTKTSIWVDSGIPGEKSTISKDIIIIKLKDLIKFYESKITFEYNKDDQILYFIES